MEEILSYLNRQENEEHLYNYFYNFNLEDLKEAYCSYYYAKEIDIENYNETFLEFQERFKDITVDEMLEDISGKTLHALKYYLENIEEKITKHEQKIERIREEQGIEEEKKNEWREACGY